MCWNQSPLEFLYSNFVTVPCRLGLLKPQSNHKDLKCTFCTLYPAILCIVFFFNSWTCFLIAAGPHSIFYVFGHACILAFARALCTLHPFQYTLIFVYDMTHVCYFYINELTEYSYACFHTKITVFVCTFIFQPFASTVDYLVLIASVNIYWHWYYIWYYKCTSICVCVFFVARPVLCWNLLHAPVLVRRFQRWKHPLWE